MPALTAAPQPLSYSVKDAAAALGISPALLERVIARGDVNPQWIDGKRVIAATELQSYIKALPYDRAVN